MNYLLYQAYGKQEIIHEAIYSILSFLCTNSTGKGHDVAIVVYTDNSAAFEKIFSAKHNIVYEALPGEKVQEWRGEIDFVHRVKIKMLQDFFSKYGGNMLYVDTDTYFLKDVKDVFDRIGRGELFMHVSEGVIATSKVVLLKKVKKFISGRQFRLADGSTVQMPATTEMWNAGAIGMNAQHKSLLDRVLSLTDVMYREYPKHVMEQLAFSYFLQTTRKVQPLDRHIYHYWNFKEFRSVLDAFFKKHSGQAADELIPLIPAIAPMELIKPKIEYLQLPFWGKWLRKLKGEKWKMPDNEELKIRN